MSNKLSKKVVTFSKIAKYITTQTKNSFVAELLAYTGVSISGFATFFSSSQTAPYVVNEYYSLISVISAFKNYYTEKFQNYINTHECINNEDCDSNDLIDDNAEKIFISTCKDFAKLLEGNLTPYTQKLYQILAQIDSSLSNSEIYSTLDYILNSNEKFREDVENYIEDRSKILQKDVAIIDENIKDIQSDLRNQLSGAIDIIENSSDCTKEELSKIKSQLSSLINAASYILGSIPSLQERFNNFSSKVCAVEDMTQETKINIKTGLKNDNVIIQNQDKQLKLLEKLRKVDNAENPLNLTVFENLTNIGEGSIKYFLFKYQSIPIVGRKNELEILFRFLNNKEHLQWGGIVGSGGIGKSALALKFCREAQNQGWNAGFISSELDFEKTKNWIPEVKTLIVFDYASSSATRISKYIIALDKHIKNDELTVPVRLLLLERDLNDSWYRDRFLYGDYVPLLQKYMFSFKDINSISIDSEYSDKFHPDFYKNIMHLNSIHPEAVFEIYTNIMEISYNSKTKISKEKFIDILKRIDSQMRPLFVILTVVGLIKLESKLSWTYHDVIDNALEEYEHVWAKLNISDKERNLLAFVTMIGGIDESVNSKEIKKEFSTVTGISLAEEYDLKPFWDCLNNINNKSKQVPEECDETNIRHNLLCDYVESNGYYFANLEPDILGEAFVIKTLFNKPKLLKSFVSAAWIINPLGFSAFLNKIFNDFKDDITLKKITRTLIDIPTPKLNSASYFWAVGIPLGIGSLCDISLKEKTYKTLKELSVNCCNKELVIAQAYCAANLTSHDLDYSLVINLYNDVKILFEKYGCSEIHYQLANILRNLTLRTDDFSKASMHYESIKEICKTENSQTFYLFQAQAAITLTNKDISYSDALYYYKEIGQLAEKTQSYRLIILLTQIAVNLSTKPSSFSRLNQVYKTVKEIAAQSGDEEAIIAQAKVATHLAARSNNLSQRKKIYRDLCLLKKVNNHGVVGMSQAMVALNIVNDITSPVEAEPYVNVLKSVEFRDGNKTICTFFDLINKSSEE